MSDQQTMDNFVGLSAVLTGFNKSVIAPSIDPINIKKDYLARFKCEYKDLYTEILNQYVAFKADGQSDYDIGTNMLAIPNFEMPCRQLIFLWYSGAWGSVQTTKCKDQVTGKEIITKSVVSSMLSSKSYTQGLAWQVMQSHPMGDSNYRYGYWSEQPAPLSGYTGNTNDKTN